LQLTFQQARLHITQYLAGRQQSLQFRRTDPNAGQFKGLIITAVVEKPAVILILFQRCAQVVTQFCNQAVKRRLRTLQPLHQVLSRDRRAPLAQDIMQMV
jgi:hypothetical protein